MKNTPHGVAGVEWQCGFARGKWNPSEWRRLKSARWTHAGGWVQQDRCIANEVPADATPEDMLERRAPETYSSMLWQQQLTGPVTVASRMEFTDRMAPLIVFAADPEPAAAGIPEYREHWEIVLFDEGINVWHHQRDENNRPVFYLQAFLRGRFAPGVIHDLQVPLTPRGERGEMRVRCGDYEFGFESAALPLDFFAGITGCEGVNYFYDFRVAASITSNRYLQSTDAGCMVSAGEREVV